MPPVEEWSCLVTMEERMVRSDETMLAQESSHDVSMPGISRGCLTVVREDKGQEFRDVLILLSGGADGRKGGRVKSRPRGPALLTYCSHMAVVEGAILRKQARVIQSSCASLHRICVSRDRARAWRLEK